MREGEGRGLLELQERKGQLVRLSVEVIERVRASVGVALLGTDCHLADGCLRECVCLLSSPDVVKKRTNKNGLDDRK